MTDLELLECTQSIYDFLLDDVVVNGPNRSFNSFMEIESFIKMNETLIKYNFCKGSGVSDMVGFTSMLNNEFEIYDDDIFKERMANDPKSFFSTTKSHEFYKIILRELKIKLYLDN
jgi:hypothetical protein